MYKMKHQTEGKASPIPIFKLTPLLCLLMIVFEKIVGILDFSLSTIDTTPEIVTLFFSYCIVNDR